MVMMALQARQKEFGSYLMKGFPTLGLAGWPRKSAAAICGNATQENLCRPVTIGAKDHGSDGVMQWRLDRLTNMQRFCNMHFGRWDTLEAQAAFVMYEIKSSYPSLYEELSNGNQSIVQLTDDVCWLYERPARQSANIGYLPGTGHGQPGRVNFAYDCDALLTKSTVSQSAPKTVVVVTGVVTTTAVAAGAAHSSFGAPLWLVLIIVGIGLVAVATVIMQHVGPKLLAPDPPAPPPTSGVT